MHPTVTPAVLVPAENARTIHAFLRDHLSDLVTATCQMEGDETAPLLICNRPDDWLKINDLLREIRLLGTGLSDLPSPPPPRMQEWLAALITGSARLIIRGCPA